MRQPKKWVYLFSFLPGWGHLYLGLMNRGLQFMLLFWGGIFIAAQASFASILVFLPVLLFYSYYDALQYYHRILEYGEAKDEPIFQWGIFKTQKPLVGWALIIFGLFAFLQMLFDYLPYEITQYIPYNFLQQLVVALIFIGVGVKLLRGEKNNAEEEQK